MTAPTARPGLRGPKASFTRQRCGELLQPEMSWFDLMLISENLGISKMKNFFCSESTFFGSVSFLFFAAIVSKIEKKNFSSENNFNFCEIFRKRCRPKFYWKTFWAFEVFFFLFSFQPQLRLAFIWTRLEPIRPISWWCFNSPNLSKRATSEL